MILWGERDRLEVFVRLDPTAMLGAILSMMLKLLAGVLSLFPYHAPLMPVIARCVVDMDVFASEFVVRAWRENLDVREIPIQLEEKRQPSIHLFKRVPNVLKNVARLVYVIRVRGQ